MKTIETNAIISPDGQMTVQVPSDIVPGEHRIVLMIDEATILSKEETAPELDVEKNILVQMQPLSRQRAKINIKHLGRAKLRMVYDDSLPLE